MKFVLPILLSSIATAGSAAASGGDLHLVRGGKTDYRIVVSVSATDFERKAALALQADLKKVSGALLPIVDDSTFPIETEILIGKNQRLADLGIGVDFQKLGAEGYTMQTVGQRLVIAGGDQLGNLYGVYTFMEDYIGCRWLAADELYYPHLPTISIKPTKVTTVPKIVYRMVYQAELMDPRIETRLKMNGNAYPPTVGGDSVYKIRPSINGWCHTFFNFVSPDEYFKTYPEYFAMRDGKRQPVQLCLTNPDVQKIVIEKVAKLFKQYPQYLCINVSQMDNGEPCTCDKCKAIDDREGSYSGTILTFVNAVAKHFPNKRINTLAYWYSTAPPKNVRPAKNVHIMFCTDTDQRPPVIDWYNGWVKIAPLRYHWYYVIPCHNSVAPWPNLFLLKRDISKWANEGMTGMFVEGSYERGSEFADLRGYLLAKLLWDPNCDIEKHLNDFVNGYYGPAAKPIHDYIYEMNKAFVDTKDTLNTHEWSRHHAATFFTPKLLARYDELFDQAELAAANNPKILNRVYKARIPLMHAEIQLKYGDVDNRIKLANRLRQLAHETDLKFFGDFGYRPTDEYMDEVMNNLLSEKKGQ